MIVGTRGHYYVRKGGLIDDFETAIQEVVGLATTELGRLMAAHGPGKELGVAPTTVNDDVPVGYNDRFGEALRLNGREVSKVAGDGYCLFHAVAIGLGRQGEGMVIHKEVLAALENRKEEIREFVDGTVEDYLDRLKGGYGDEIEIRYMKEIYNKDITIWIQDSALGATTDAMYPVVEGAIHIAYRDGVHYDAVVPLKPASEDSMGFNPVHSPVLENQNVTEPEGPPAIDEPPVAGTNEETQRTIGRLGIVFWNSNGWEQDRCEKIAEGKRKQMLYACWMPGCTLQGRST